jgi:epoxyqueuosine reductase
MASCNDWLGETIADLLWSAPENHLKDFGGLPVFDAPRIGIAGGDDPLFRALREAVAPAHLLPREILAREGGRAGAAAPAARIRVVAWALPFSQDVIRSNRGGEWPSALYSVARNNGGALNLELGRRLAAAIRRLGYSAVVPALADAYDAFRAPRTVFASTWSERHVAFAAGLGTFGLNGFLISRSGVMARLGSLVTDMPLEPARTRAADHRAPCLADGGKACGACIAACPVGAISSEGIDKEKCYVRRNEIRARWLDPYAGTYRLIPALIAKAGQKEPGFSLGCALCASGVPCESTDPYAAESRTPHA